MRRAVVDTSARYHISPLRPGRPARSEPPSRPGVPRGHTTMLASYLPLFMMLAVAAALALTFFGLTTIFGPKNPSKEKSLPYESGSESVGAKHVRLSVKFYLTAI